MRLIGLILIALLSSSAHAEDVSKIHFDAHARARFEVDDYTNYSNSRAMMLFRIRPKFTYEANPRTRLILEPQFARTLGEGVVSSASTSGSVEQTSGVTSDPSLGVHQAYFDYRFSGRARIITGRQVLSFGDELLVGALEWNNVARTFDALRFQVAKDATYQFDYFWSKLVESNALGSGAGDYDFMGANHAWKMNGWLREADAYLFFMKDSRGNGSDPLNLATTGVRTKMKQGAFDLRMEATQQFGRVNGSRAGSHGTQGDLELGISSENNTTRCGVEVFYADAEYNQLFPTVHKWLGIADVFGRRNIAGGRLFASVKPIDAFKLSLDYHLFTRVDRDLPAYRTNGTAIVGSVASKKSLGSEVDLMGNYQLDEKNSLQAGFAVFFAAQSLRQVRSGNPAFGYLAWEIRL